MSDYNIYAGLGGSFGGATYKGTIKDSSIIEASDIAYEIAVEEYESYGELYGLKDWDACVEEFCEEEGLEHCSETECEYADEINDKYENAIEDWISYYAILKEDDEDFDESEYYEI